MFSFHHLGSAANISQLEGQIEDVLLDTFKKFNHVPETTYIKNDQHKWRAASALQKAVRRGNVEVARRMANGLHTLDPDYVWRRLCTIAIEDIGIGDLGLVASFFWVSGKKQWKNKNGGDREWLLMMVELLCRAPKDRNACDLLVWADLDPSLADVRSKWEKAHSGNQPNFDEMMAVYTTSEVMLAKRMIAGWVMAGTKKNPGAGFPHNNVNGHIGYIVEASERLEQPFLVQYVVRQGASKQREGMPMALPLIYSMDKPEFDGIYLHGKSPVVKPDALVQMPPIGNYPSEAFDAHTQEGKKAIGYLKKACEPIGEFLKNIQLNPADHAWAVGTLLFRIEGHQVNERLVYQGSEDLVELAEMSHLLGNKIPADYCDYGMRLMTANMPMMHYARMKVVNVMPPGFNIEKPKSVSVENNPKPEKSGEKSDDEDGHAPSPSGEQYAIEMPDGVNLYVPKEKAEEMAASLGAKVLGPVDLSMDFPLQKPASKLIVDAENKITFLSTPQAYDGVFWHKLEGEKAPDLIDKINKTFMLSPSVLSQSLSSGKAPQVVEMPNIKCFKIQKSAAEMGLGGFNKVMSELKEGFMKDVHPVVYKAVKLIALWAANLKLHHSDLPHCHLAVEKVSPTKLKLHLDFIGKPVSASPVIEVFVDEMLPMENWTELALDVLHFIYGGMAVSKEEIQEFVGKVSHDLCHNSMGMLSTIIGSANAELYHYGQSKDKGDGFYLLHGKGAAIMVIAHEGTVTKWDVPMQVEELHKQGPYTVWRVSDSQFKNDLLLLADKIAHASINKVFFVTGGPVTADTLKVMLTPALQAQMTYPLSSAVLSPIFKSQGPNLQQIPKTQINKMMTQWKSKPPLMQIDIEGSHSTSDLMKKLKHAASYGMSEVKKTEIEFQACIDEWPLVYSSGVSLKDQEVAMKKVVKFVAADLVMWESVNAQAESISELAFALEKLCLEAAKKYALKVPYTVPGSTNKTLDFIVKWAFKFSDVDITKLYKKPPKLKPEFPAIKKVPPTNDFVLGWDIAKEVPVPNVGSGEGDISGDPPYEEQEEDLLDTGKSYVEQMEEDYQQVLKWQAELEEMAIKKPGSIKIKLPEKQGESTPTPPADPGDKEN